MKRINKKHFTSAMLLAAIIALLLMQLVRANPIEVSITPLTGPVGTTVTVSGIADTSGGNVSIYFDINGNGQTDVGEFQKNATASVTSPYSYEATITVPPSIAGTHAIIAADVIAGTSTGAYFTVTSEITISPASGPIGEVITVTGTGFDRISVVEIKFDDVDVTSSPAPQTNDVGSFTTSFPAPPSIAGDHIVTATDAAGNTYSTTFTVFGVTTSITPNSGPVGTIVTVSGTYATPGESVAIWWDNAEVDIINAEGDGTYSYDLTVPPSVAGAHNVTAEDVKSTNNASETFILLGITLSITPTSGSVGTIVSVTGTFATPGGSIVIRWDGTEIGTITSELDGTYSHDLTIPASVTGDHALTVEDVASTNTATQTFTVEPKIILTPEDGVVGDSVTVTGTGFSGASQVDVYFDINKDGLPDDNELMLDDVPTDEFGSFESSFTVPWVSTAGNYLIIAVDAEGVTDDATFTVLFVMYTRSGEYFQGDYPSFFINAAEKTGDPKEGAEVVVSVYDPAGYLQYKGVTVTIEDGTVPYDMQFFNWWMLDEMGIIQLTPLHLPSDATVGTWTWTAVADGLTINGSFEVVEPVDLRTLLGKLDQLLEGQQDAADLIVHYGEKLQLDHERLAELITAVSDKLQLNQEELVDLINQVAQQLQLDHEDIIQLIASLSEDLQLKLGNLSALLTEVADKLQLNHQELITLITEVTDELKLDHQALADLVNNVFDVLEIKLDDIKTQTRGITENVDGLYLVIGNLEVKLDDINAKVVDIQGSIATVSTTLGEIQVKLTDIQAQLVEIKDGMAIIDTELGQIEVKLDDIQPKLVDIQGSLATVTTTLGEIETKIDNLGAVSLEEIKGDIATIKSDIGTIKVNVSNINANITSIKGRIATVETTLGTMQVDIDAINGRIEQLEGTTATIRTDIGTMKVSLTDINAKITVMNNNEATIQTDIGTIKGTLTDVKDNVATIVTDVGTVNERTESIETTSGSIKSDTSWQTPTVALSLIAAIAAIAAAVLVLRKVYMK